MYVRLGLAGLYGIAGVIALLAEAIYRLVPLALALLDLTLAPFEIAVLVGWVGFNAYAEGYRGFQRAFAPRVVVRAMHLSAHPRPLFVLLAPLYCMGLIHATRKRLVIAWSLTLGIIGIVVLVRRLEQPWRGIIDAGVVVGLAWGVTAIVWFTARALAGRPPDVAADVPRS